MQGFICSHTLVIRALQFIAITLATSAQYTKQFEGAYCARATPRPTASDLVLGTDASGLRAGHRISFPVFWHAVLLINN